MAMVIGKMRLVTYDEGSILCEQGDNANEFFVCMEGTLRVEVNNSLYGPWANATILGRKRCLGRMQLGEPPSPRALRRKCSFCLGTSLSFSKTTGCQSNKSSLMSSINRTNKKKIKHLKMLRRTRQGHSKLLNAPHTYRDNQAL